jgi:hypothetical protein
MKPARDEIARRRMIAFHSLLSAGVPRAEAEERADAAAAVYAAGGEPPELVGQPPSRADGRVFREDRADASSPVERHLAGATAWSKIWGAR